MRAIRHPMSGAVYDLQEDGNVRVEKDGMTGLFRPDGTYISGDIHSADPQLCGWIGGCDVRATAPLRARAEGKLRNDAGRETAAQFIAAAHVSAANRRRHASRP